MICMGVREVYTGLNGDHIDVYRLICNVESDVYICRCRGIWVVVKIMVPFWIPSIIRPLIFRVPKKGP